MTTELYNQYQNSNLSLSYYEKLAEYCIQKLKEKNELSIAHLMERYLKMFTLIAINIFTKKSKELFGIELKYESKNDFFNFYSFLDLTISSGHDNSYLSFDLAKSFCIGKTYDVQSLITTLIGCGVKIADIFMKKSVTLIKAKGFEDEYEKSDLKKHEERFDSEIVEILEMIYLSGE